MNDVRYEITVEPTKSKPGGVRSYGDFSRCCDAFIKLFKQRRSARMWRVEGNTRERIGEIWRDEEARRWRYYIDNVEVEHGT